MTVLRPSSDKNGLKALRNGHDTVNMFIKNGTVGDLERRTIRKVLERFGTISGKRSRYGQASKTKEEL